jgi:hypothetical protein
LTTPISEERVRKGAEKLAKSLNAKQQGRLDGFFMATSKTSVPKASVKNAKGKDDKGKGTKRKVSPWAGLPVGFYLLILYANRRRKIRRKRGAVKSLRLKSNFKY